MSPRASVIRLLNRVYKREIDPRRVERTFMEFDIARGYQRYHDICRYRFSRRDFPYPGGPLQEQGFEYLDVLDPAQSLDLIRKVGSSHDISRLKKGTSNLEGYHLQDPALIEDILSQVLAGNMDRRLVSYFQSEYLVHWLLFSVTPQGEEQKSVSFRWHCDKGPGTWLKLIVYLNPSAEHGGGTEFIPIADTEAVGRRGYLFGWSHARTDDIGHLSGIAGRELHSHLKEMRAGEGVLFQPSRVLHRGVGPDAGRRFALTLCLLPSPVHWQDALRFGTLSDLTVDDTWHHDADELLNAIRQGRTRATGQRGSD